MNTPTLSLPRPAGELWRRIGATVREEVRSITGSFDDGEGKLDNALYTACCIRTRDGAIEVTTATRAQSEKTRRIETANAEHDFEAAGLNAYLRAKGPGAEALLDYARETCARYQDRLVFEADAGGVKAWQTAKASMNVATANPR